MHKQASLILLAMQYGNKYRPYHVTLAFTITGEIFAQPATK